MATPFSFTGWNTASVAPAPTVVTAAAPIVPVKATPVARPALPPGNTYDKKQPKNLPPGVFAAHGPSGGYNTVKAPMARPAAPTPLTSVQTGGNAIAPGAFSFTGWNSSHLVPKVTGAPVVQGTLSDVGANAIPIGTGGPATGTDVGGSGVPDVITKAQGTLDTFSNPSVLSFFSKLLDQNKGGGGTTIVNSVAPGQAQLNRAKLNALSEPQNLQNQLAALAKQRADLQTPGFGFYAGSEQERIDNAVRNLQTRLGPAQQSAASLGLARPSTSYVPAGRSSSGWMSPMGGMI